MQLVDLLALLRRGLLSSASALAFSCPAQTGAPVITTQPADTTVVLGAIALVFSAVAADAPEDADRSGWFVRLGGRGSSGLKDDPQFGGEIVSGFEFFRFDIGKREARFGFEFGHSHGHSQSTVSDRAVAMGSATHSMDRFALDAASAGNPVTPPSDPYPGTAGTPGPLIGLSPSAHTVLTTTGTSTLDSKLDSEFHNLRIGRRMSLSLSAGYVAIYSSSHLDLAENVAFADPTVPVPAAASGRLIATHCPPPARTRRSGRITALPAMSACTWAATSSTAPARPAVPRAARPASTSATPTAPWMA